MPVPRASTPRPRKGAAVVPTWSWAARGTERATTARRSRSLFIVGSRLLDQGELPRLLPDVRSLDVVEVDAVGGLEALARAEVPAHRPVVDRAVVRHLSHERAAHVVDAHAR